MSVYSMVVSCIIARLENIFLSLTKYFQICPDFFPICPNNFQAGQRRLAPAPFSYAYGLKKFLSKAKTLRENSLAVWLFIYLFVFINFDD